MYGGPLVDPPLAKTLTFRTLTYPTFKKELLKQESLLRFPKQKIDELCYAKV